MFKPDAVEAAPIVDATLDALLTWLPTRGRTGADVRAIVGDVRANAVSLLQYDMIDGPLITCFEYARRAGLTLVQCEAVRRIAAEQPAKLVGAIMTRDTLMLLAMATQGQLIAGMTFRTRTEVEQIKNVVNTAYAEMEESLADKMDSMTYRALVRLGAAITFHLYETARPLPRMLNFRFNMPLPTIVLAHRLYYDAGRADELRIENHVVHPAFMLPRGRALSK